MSLLGVGTLAFDTIETPFDRRERILGGSASYFAYAASFFSPVRLVGRVGMDWPGEFSETLLARNISLAGVEHSHQHKSYFWSGRYIHDYQDRETLALETAGFESYQPVVPEAYRDSRYIFLAAAAPTVQIATMEQCPEKKLAFADTLDFWIDTQRDELLRLLPLLDGLFINDCEARQLTGERHTLRAVHAILEMGPRWVVLKKGEHGCLVLSSELPIALPSYPTDDIVDPTGAGDSFAGGVLGYMAGVDKFDRNTMVEALMYGTVIASYTITDFSVAGLAKVSRADLDSRVAVLKQMMTGSN